MTDTTTNTIPKRWLSIVGIGEDGIAGLSPIAQRLIKAADLVVGGRRHLTLADALISGARLAWPSPIHDAFPQILAKRGHGVTVLATGDPFHFGIGKQIAALVPPNEFVSIPNISAYSLAAARMGWALQDIATITLHGRPLEVIVRHLQPGARILALSWDDTTPQKLASLLAERGFGASRLVVLESMGGPRERIRAAPAQDFNVPGIDSLNTIAIEIEASPDAPIVSLATGLDDSFYENDGQLSKREVRAVVLSSLAPRQSELLWDIGLGAGSVAIEWMLCHPTLRAIGIEARQDRAERATRNAAAFGLSELEIMVGQAPEVLKGLPQPDAVFIGGGLTAGVLETAWQSLKSGGRLVANAVTLESEAILFDAFGRLGGELTRLEICRADKVGDLHGWRTSMPITHWRIAKS